MVYLLLRVVCQLYWKSMTVLIQNLIQWCVSYKFLCLHMQGKIREMMEKAFWDGVIESMEGDNPQYDQVVQLMKEVRDEICEIAPESWKAEIIETIDLDILTQVDLLLHSLARRNVCLVKAKFPFS